MANVKNMIWRLYFLFCFYLYITEGRIHKLQIKKDNRNVMVMTRFGFLQKGYLYLHVTGLQIMGSRAKEVMQNGSISNFGLTLARTTSNGVSSSLEDGDKCPLHFSDMDVKKTDADVSIIYFNINFKNRTLMLNRSGDSFANLTILHLNEEEYSKWPTLGDDKGNLTDISKVTNSIPLLQQTTKQGIIEYNFHFLVEINSKQEEGLYILDFHNCVHDELSVSFVADIVEKNDDNYLSAGQMPLPTLRFLLCAVYVVMAVLWVYVLRNAEEGVFKIHYLMFVLLLVKALAVLFHGLNSYFIQIRGHHEEALAVIYYITYLMRGILLFVTIVLIGAGWAFVKYILSERDKKIFIIVLPLQILANVAQIIIEETEEGESQYTTWGKVLILVDLLCCGAILFPVVWSIRHLQEASQIDGKAAISLAKLKIFRHFYILIVCYIYFTRIIVYLLTITVPFEYEWINEVFKEIATVVFFSVTGFKFRPMSNNPYLQVPTSDDETEMDEVVTKNVAFENLTHVNQKTDETRDITGIKQRESSHEYD